MYDGCTKESIMHKHLPSESAPTRAWLSLLALLAMMLLAACGGAQIQRAPATPTEVELHANSDSSITISWQAAAGATSYRIYRGTKPGGEGKIAIAQTGATTYRDSETLLHRDFRMLMKR